MNTQLSIPRDILELAPHDVSCRAAALQSLLHSIYRAIDEAKLDSSWGPQIGELLETRREAQLIEQAIYCVGSDA